MITKEQEKDKEAINPYMKIKNNNSARKDTKKVDNLIPLLSKQRTTEPILWIFNESQFYSRFFML